MPEGSAGGWCRENHLHCLHEGGNELGSATLEERDRDENGVADVVHNVGADRRVELLHNEMQVLPRAARPRALLVAMKAGRDLCGMKPRA